MQLWNNASCQADIFFDSRGLSGAAIWFLHVSYDIDILENIKWVFGATEKPWQQKMNFMVNKYDLSTKVVSEARVSNLLMKWSGHLE